MDFRQFSPTIENETLLLETKQTKILIQKPNKHCSSKRLKQNKTLVLMNL